MKKKLLIFVLFSTLLFCDGLLLLFDGNKKVSSRELYDSIGLYEPYFYEFYIKEPSIQEKETTLIIQALKDYYKSKGFYHTSITHTKDKKYIKLEIEENSPIIVDGISFVSKFDIAKEIGVSKGDIFDAKKFTQSKENIKLLYAQKSFCNIELDAKAYIDIETNKAFLSYEVIPNKECYIKSIDIYPVKNIDSKIIDSFLHIKKDELLDTNKIIKSYESLYSCEGISKAIIETEPDKNSSVDIKVRVYENEKPIRFQTGLGLSSDEGAMFLLGVKHRNFLGNLKTLGLETRVTSLKQTIKTNFDMPLEYRNFTGFEVGYDNEKFIGFKEDRVYGNLYLMQKALPHTFRESIVFDNSRTYDSDDEALFPKSSLFVISPKLEWSFDTRDKILDPRSGYFINTQMMGSLKSDISDATYYKLKADGGYLFSYKESVLALKTTFGTIGIDEGYIPSSYRFFAGGMYSNRAYGYRKLGPTNDNNDPIGSDSILEATAEVRFDIYNDFRGVVFSDNTFLGNGSIPDYDNGYYSAGVGLRYKTPIGPLAIDFGFDIADPSEHYAIHFHIGELF